MGRHHRIAAALVGTACAFLICAAPSAWAVVAGHAYLGSFGSTRVKGEPTRGGQFDSVGPIAVDQATGDIYVADGFRIQKFDAEGNFILAWGFGVNDGAEQPEVCTTAPSCQQGLPGNAPGQMGKPVGLAVDNSSGPNAGDVYVATIPEYVGHFAGPYAVLRFSPNGTFEREVDGSEAPHGAFSSLGSAPPISVDENGYLWVADGSRMIEFSNSPSNAYVGNSEIPATESPESKGEYWEEYYFLPIFSFAVDNPGRDLFVYSYYEGWCCGFYTFGPDDSILNSHATTEWPHSSTNLVFGWDPTTSQLYASGGGDVQQYEKDLEPVGEPFGSGVLTAPAGVAVNGTTGTVYVADDVPYSESEPTKYPQVRVFGPVYLATVTTEAPSVVGHTNATLNGQVAPDPRGGGAITSCYFEYGATESYGSTIPCDQSTPISGSAEVTAEVSGLTREKTYHYRLVATNGNGTNVGRDMTVTPRAVFGTTTEAPTEVTATGATLNGSFDPAGLDTHYYFKWGHNIVYGETTPSPPGEDAGSTAGTVHVSAKIEGLKSSTVYHYRLIATNSLGTSQGADEVFVSGAPDLPGVSGTAVEAVSKDSATVSAMVTGGFGNTMYLVEYGAGGEYGEVSESGILPESDNSPHEVSAQLTGLQSGVEYHFRWVATNFGGTAHGVDETFVTPAAPTAAAGSAPGVTATTANLTGTINPNRSMTTYHFEYGISTAYGAVTPESQTVGSGSTAIPVSTEVGGLAPGTTYHFRLVATNSVGTGYGPDQTVTTVAPVVAVSEPPRCKRHFVVKHGKCVKRGAGHRKNHKRHPKHVRGHGGHQGGKQHA